LNDSLYILCDPVIIFMKGQYLAVLIAFIMASVNTTSVIPYSQNETNEMDIGENQSITGTISGLGGDFGFGPRIVDDPPTHELNATK
jgi:hypothetical protein